jgi:hypothetical protein
MAAEKGPVAAGKLETGHGGGEEAGHGGGENMDTPQTSSLLKVVWYLPIHCIPPSLRSGSQKKRKKKKKRKGKGKRK